MDDSLIIYSSIFVLVCFIVINKYFIKNQLKAFGIPIILLAIYFILFNNKSTNIGINNDINFLTELPNF